jgi:LPXTG-site transpeptidase (sortase) family protein
MSIVIRIASWFLLIAGSLSLLGSGGLWAWTQWVEAQSVRPVAIPQAAPTTPRSYFAAAPPEVLEADANAALVALGLSSFRRPVLPPEPPTRIVIPRIHVDSKIIELGLKQDKNGEWVWETPAWAVGRLQGTGLPGAPGNIVMAGHISSPLSNEGNVFERLPELGPGDQAILYVGERYRVYQVVNRLIVLPTQIEVAQPTEDETLTLITCYPNWIYTHRLIVQLKPVPDQPGWEVRPRLTTSH